MFSNIVMLPGPRPIIMILRSGDLVSRAKAHPSSFNSSLGPFSQAA